MTCCGGFGGAMKQLLTYFAAMALAVAGTTLAPPAAAKPLCPGDGTLCFFVSPKGSVGCQITNESDRKSAFCWTMEPSLFAKLSADGSLEVCSNRSTVYHGSCSSNAEPDTSILPYGASLERGPFKCLSETTGVTCRVASSDRGFFISPKGVVPLGGAGSAKAGSPTSTTQTPAPASAPVIDMGKEWFLANLLSTKVYGLRAGTSAKSDQKLVDIAISTCDAIGGRGDNVAQLVADELVKQGAVSSQYDADIFVATATTAFCNY